MKRPTIAASFWFVVFGLWVSLVVFWLMRGLERGPTPGNLDLDLDLDLDPKLELELDLDLDLCQKNCREWRLSLTERRK